MRGVPSTGTLEQPNQMSARSSGPVPRRALSAVVRLAGRVLLAAAGAIGPRVPPPYWKDRRDSLR